MQKKEPNNDNDDDKKNIDLMDDVTSHLIDSLYRESFNLEIQETLHFLNSITNGYFIRIRIHFFSHPNDYRNKNY